MLEARPVPFSRSIFYRGMPLREYMKKSSEMLPSLQYKDDQTIFVDLDQNPLSGEASIVFVEQKLSNRQARAKETPRVNYGELSSKNEHIYLPSLHLRKKQKLVEKNIATDRNSTDTSLGNQLEGVSMLLPNIQTGNIIRERNITQASRSSSRSVSCRKRLVKVIPEVNQPNERKTSPERRLKKGVSLDERKMQKIIRKEDGEKIYSKAKNIKLRYGGLPNAFW